MALSTDAYLKAGAGMQLLMLEFAGLLQSVIMQIFDEFFFGIAAIAWTQMGTLGSTWIYLPDNSS